MSNKLVNDTNINNKVDKIAEEQNVSNVNLTMLGLDASKKLISVISAKGKFILAVIQIGKYILTNLQGKFGPCINKQKNNGSEDFKEPVQLLNGQALHAYLLGLTHPISGENILFESALPPEMAAVIV